MSCKGFALERLLAIAVLAITMGKAMVVYPILFPISSADSTAFFLLTMVEIYVEIGLKHNLILTSIWSLPGDSSADSPAWNSEMACHNYREFNCLITGKEESTVLYYVLGVNERLS